VTLGAATVEWHDRGESVRRTFDVEVDNIARQITTARAGLCPDNGDSPDIPDVWQQVTSIEDQAAGLGDEALLFTNGVMLRCLGLDDGYCGVVDLLLAEVAEKTNVSWDRVSVPATSHLTSGRVELVGVRLYDRTIWSMPLAVHELGHFAAERLGFRRRRLAAQVVAESPAYGDFGEHFADLYAAVALGPAYLATLVERADPSNVDRPRAHPVWRERVYLVSRTLERRQAATPALRTTLNHLSTLWEQSCASAQCAPWPAHEVRDELDEFSAKADAAIGQSSPAEDLEPSWREVERATGELERRWTKPTTSSLRVVINAAWRARLRLDPQGLADPEAAAALEQRARHWLDEIRAEVAT
jgi:hypothetical protein